MITDDPLGSFGEVLRQLAAAPEIPPRPPIASGTVVDESFVIVRRLGAGGMGTVYLAHDERLGRDVAIKLHSAVHTEEATLREAQVMARFKHPNVVAVYRVGTHAGRVFVAMEYLAGGTLADWLAVEPRPWREILARLVAAGRGLAAAHAAGVVHRDFKPANVLFDKDRVCVSDFGLAHDVDDAHDDRGAPRTGGTPAYMAPEQQRGEVVGPAADQYGFCVAAWEALYGARPFETAREAPARFEALLRRGLAPRPEDRWPSLVALLDALELDPEVARGRRLRFAAVVGAVAVLTGAAVLAVVAARTPAAVAPCRDAAERLADDWSPARRAAVEQAFLATGLGRAAETFERVASHVDRYAATWTGARTAACEATHVHHEQSVDALDRRVWCLDDLRGRLGAAVDLLAGTVDAPLLDRAIGLTSGLEDPAVCDHADVLAERLPPPGDPALRARFDAATAQLQALGVRAHTGRLQEVLAGSEPVLAEARAIGHPGLTARVHQVVGLAYQRAGRTDDAERGWNEAALAAAEAHDDLLLARIWSNLVFLLADQRTRVDDAERMLPVAEAALARVGDDPTSKATLHGAHGRIALARGRFDEAVTEMEHALEAHRAASGDGHLLVAGARHDLALALLEVGRHDEALEAYRDALATFERVLGPDHHETATALLHLGDLLHRMGRSAEARPLLARSVAISEKSFGADDVTVGETLEVLARVDRALGRKRDAQAEAARAAAVRAAEEP